MAERIAKEIFPESFEISSAGLNAWEGSRASDNAIAIMLEDGINLENHSAEMLSAEKMLWADLVVPMTLVQEEQLKIYFPQYKSKIKRLGAWAGTEKDVTDPWGGSLDRYSFCKNEIEVMLQEMLKALAETNEEED
jgi:protein-tyrosine phosphatase